MMPGGKISTAFSSSSVAAIPREKQMSQGVWVGENGLMSHDAACGYIYKKNKPEVQKCH